MSKELVRQLKELKQVNDQLTPDRAWVETNRAELLRRITVEQPQRVVEEKEVPLRGLANLFSPLSIFVPKSLQYLRPMMMVLIAIGILTSGWIATASAKLGDTFYPVKLAAEKTQVALVAVVGDEEAKAKLQLELASRRAEEVKASAEEKATIESPERKKKLAEAEKKAIASLQTNLEKTQETIKHVTEKDPNKAVELLEDAHQQTEEIVGDLKEAASKSSTDNVELTEDIARTTKEVRDGKLDTIQKVLEKNGDDQRVKVIAVEAIDAVVKDFSEVNTTTTSTTAIPLSPLANPSTTSSPATSTTTPTSTTEIVQPTSSTPTVIAPRTVDPKELESKVRQPDVSSQELIEAIGTAKEMNNQTQVVAPVQTTTSAPAPAQAPTPTQTSPVVPPTSTSQ